MVKIIYEKKIYNIIHAYLSVYKHFGYGFLGAVYQEALTIELKNNKIPFVQEKYLDIYYRNIQLKKRYSADFVCFEKIILELKATTKISIDSEFQLYNYLKATGLKLGLLINFGEKSIICKRIVL